MGRLRLPAGVRGAVQGAGTSSLVAARKGSLKPCRESPKVLVQAEFQEAGLVGLGLKRPMVRMRLQAEFGGCTVRRTEEPVMGLKLL